MFYVKQMTAYGMRISDWSSDVCSSDLQPHYRYAPDAIAVMATAPWPGNVRQLFNVVEQTVALTPRRTIGAALVRKCLGEFTEGLPAFDEARDEFARTYLRQLLELSGEIGRAHV